ncbi:MAG: RNA polymerase sigma factor [Myxococcota bacterium]
MSTDANSAGAKICSVGARAQPSDIALMHRAGAGDREAQRVLVTRLMGRANRLAQALLRNREDAFDASQAALLGILRSAANFRGDSSVERWADRIVVRTALRLSRARRRGAPTQISESAAPSTPPRSEARVSAREYLKQLPEAQRSVLLLRSGFGYSIDEIAELTQTSINTVKDRLKRAKDAMRRELQREQELGASRTELRVANQRR